MVEEWERMILTSTSEFRMYVQTWVYACPPKCKTCIHSYVLSLQPHPPSTYTHQRNWKKKKKSLDISKCKCYGVLYKELCFKNVRCICNGCCVSQHVTSHHSTQHSVITQKWSSFGKWKKWVNEVSHHNHLESAHLLKLPCWDDQSTASFVLRCPLPFLLLGRR